MLSSFLKPVHLDAAHIVVVAGESVFHECGGKYLCLLGMALIFFSKIREKLLLIRLYHVFHQDLH